jgi:hypothetical protein
VAYLLLEVWAVNKSDFGFETIPFSPCVIDLFQRPFFIAFDLIQVAGHLSSLTCPVI